MWLAAGGLAAAFSISVEDFSLLSAHQTKRALSLPNGTLREKMHSGLRATGTSRQAAQSQERN